MGGLAEIDVEDWKRNTEYNNYRSTDQPIVWFWKVMCVCVCLFVCVAVCMCICLYVLEGQYVWVGMCRYLIEEGCPSGCVQCFFVMYL